MTWNGYEFDEGYKPEGFEEWAHDQVNGGYAFYLRGKYVLDDTGIEIEQQGDDDDLYIFCPRTEEVFDADQKEVFGEGTTKIMCSSGYRMHTDPACPRERYCGRTCRLLNAAYGYGQSINRTDDFAFYQRTDRGMMLRAFSYTVRYEGEKYELRRCGVGMFTEWLRIFYNADRTTEIWSRLRNNYHPYSGYFPTIQWEWRKKRLYQQYATFKVYSEDLTGTLLEGYAKYFDRTESYMDNAVKRAVLLIAMFRTPALKEVIKSGYDGIVEDYVCSLVAEIPKIRNAVRGGAKSIKQFFGFELSKLNRLTAKQKAGLKFGDMKGLKLLIENGVAVTGETLTMSRNYKFESLCGLYEGKALREVLKYTRRQKISASAAASDYMDYIGQIMALHLDVTDRSIVFPKDFQAAHNRYSKLLEYERTQELCKKFTDQAKKLRFACFRQGDLSLRVIRTPAELKIWAKRFRNCAAGRADRVASGRSLMCVIVNVHKPKAPYFMLEYDLQGRTIVECRGYDNRKTEKDDPAAEEFCGKWLKFIEQRGATRAGKKKVGLAA